MKKLNLPVPLLYGGIYLSLPVLLMTGCYKPTPLPSDAPPKTQLQSDSGVLYDVVVIDNCQYLSAHGKIGSEHLVAHKGNCTNVVHVYNPPQ